MKNIYKLLIAMVVLVSSTELAKAQSTFEKPYPGSTHNYNFDNIDAASTTTWYISRAATIDAAAITSTDGDFAHFTLSTPDGATVAGNDGNLTGTGINEVKIVWNGTATGTYYLFVNVEKDGCSNVKGIQIVVQSGEFNAMIADVTGSATPGSVDPSDPANDITNKTCPDQTTISPIVNMDPDNYSLGTSKLVYRVNREFTNTTNGWQVTFDALRAGASITKVVDAAGTELTAGSIVTVGGTQDYILVTVTVDNEIATADVVLTINSLGTQDLVTSATDNETADNNATHTFSTMPTIGTMGGN
ncbi:hypothetical protein [Marinifilum sp. D737]|uniref:hypothetical protein n=1 Tax=Marinifilum sp. D737 TaxID=2969628 RepID=UPI002273FF8C|nr:hypothetical protein [Marinifilum sp. D737]MCY1635868.1 hypothetical protein [Marinifilum sp. D737]